MRDTYEIKRYYLKSPKKSSIGTPIKIVMLSDLHNACYGKENSRLIADIVQLDPDLVLVGGDMLIGHKNTPMEVAISLMKKLSEKFLVYYALGNHEYRMKMHPDSYGNAYEKFRKALEKSKIHFLENEMEKIRIKDMDLAIYGLELNENYYSKKLHPECDPKIVEHTFGKADENYYNILLAHTPKYARYYALWNPDLVLSGHYHGGVMRISPKIGLISPYLRPIPRYCCGHFRIKNTDMIVSSGLGEHTLPLRIHNPRQLVVINIQNKGEKDGNTSKTSSL